jgi:hypothetical protein
MSAKARAPTTRGAPLSYAKFELLAASILAALGWKRGRGGNYNPTYSLPIYPKFHNPIPSHDLWRRMNIQSFAP